MIPGHFADLLTYQSVLYVFYSDLVTPIKSIFSGVHGTASFRLDYTGVGLHPQPHARKHLMSFLLMYLHLNTKRQFNP